MPYNQHQNQNYQMQNYPQQQNNFGLQQPPAYPVYTTYPAAKY